MHLTHKKINPQQSVAQGEVHAICECNNLCSQSVDREVYTVVLLPKTIHARFAVVFRFWKEQHVKKNGNVAFHIKLKAQSLLKSRKKSKRAKLSSDEGNNAVTSQFSDNMKKEELRETYKKRGLIVGGNKK